MRTLIESLIFIALAFAAGCLASPLIVPTIGRAIDQQLSQYERSAAVAQNHSFERAAQAR